MERIDQFQQALMASETKFVKCILGESEFYLSREIIAAALFNIRVGKKYVRYKEGAELYSMSERKFMDLAKNADAVDHVEKVALVNLSKIDTHIKKINQRY